MSKIAKQAFKKAVKEIEKAKIDEIKVLVRQALEAKEKAERDRRDAVRRIQVIKQDIEDLKQGRLQLIKERHEKNKEADQHSPITVEKVKQIFLPHTASAHTITWTGGNTSLTSGTFTSNDTAFTITNNINDTLQTSDLNLINYSLRDMVPGTYELTSGIIQSI